MKDLLSATEVARRLGVSRTQVFLLIRKGLLKAEKVGRNYVVRREDFEEYATVRPVKKAVEEFGETLKRLGDV